MEIKVTNLAYIPKLHLGRQGLNNIKAQLTIYPRTFKDEFKEVLCYEETTDSLGIPYAYAKQCFPHFYYRDERSLGLAQQAVYPTPDPNHPKAPENQAQYMGEVYEALKEYNNLFFKADTGVGKTYIGLNAVIKLGRRTLIIVPKSDLAKQWYEDLVLVIGVPKEVVCFYDKDNKKTEGKDFVIATIQSMHKDVESQEFLDSFGAIIFDEMHGTGGEKYSNVLKMFPAKYKLGLTATEDRLDGAQDVYLNHFGFNRIEAKLKPVPVHVTVIYDDSVKTAFYPEVINGKVRKWIECAKVKQIARMVASKPRFDTIVALIKKQYEQGHNILVLSDHILYLQHVNKALKELGLEETHLFVGQYYDLDPLPPLDKIGTMDKYSKSKKNIKLDEKKEILKSARVILASYGVFKEGISVPRLNVGIDITPRSECEQSLGRVRRKYEGKDYCYWYTIVDTNNDFAMRSFDSRLGEYIRLAETVKGIDANTRVVTRIK
jgi:superfamily II DNA or RNA helicase